MRAGRLHARKHILSRSCERPLRSRGHVEAAVQSKHIAGLQVHLILRHKSPKTGVIEEKHLKTPPMVLLDEYTHVYTAILHAANNS